MRSPTPVSIRRSRTHCSITPARMRSSTYWRVRASRMTDWMPSRCRRWASISPAGPAPTIPTWVRMASCLAGAGSGLEEHGLVLALEADVEAVGPRAGAARDQRRAAPAGNEGEDRIALVSRLAIEIDAGEEPAQDAAGEHADIDMRRLRRAVRARHPPRLHGAKGVASLGIALDAAEALEARVRKGGVGARIAPLPVRLPDLQHGVGDELAVAVDHAARDRDALADGVLGDEIVGGEIRDGVAPGGRQGIGEIGARRLRRRDALGPAPRRRRRISHRADLPSAWRRARAARCRSGSRAPIRARSSRCRR